MSIGGMRGKISFKSPTSIPVGGGGTSTIYTVVLTDWVEAKQLNSSRDQVEMQTMQKATYRFKLRCRNGFAPDKTMLVEYEGKDYTINGIDNIGERDRYWLITAVALK